MTRLINPTIRPMTSPMGRQTVYSSHQGGQYQPRKFRMAVMDNLQATPVSA